MSTEKLYLNNENMFELDSTVHDVRLDEDVVSISLEKTIFHPQGGGQPSDYGTIEVGNHIYNVVLAKLGEDTVWHYVENTDAPISAGEKVKLKIDIENRLKNSKIHTSGHLIAGIVEEKYTNLTAINGYHFEQGPYVEFVINDSSISKPDIDIELIQKEVNDRINSHLSVEQGNYPYEKLIGLDVNVPKFFEGNQSVRIIKIGGMKAIPCGGTHVKSLKDIPSVSILGKKNKKGRIKIKYKVK